jgi:hypothetical protein
MNILWNVILSYHYFILFNTIFYNYILYVIYYFV